MQGAQAQPSVQEDLTGLRADKPGCHTCYSRALEGCMVHSKETTAKESPSTATGEGPCPQKPEESPRGPCLQKLEKACAATETTAQHVHRQAPYEKSVAPLCALVRWLSE